MSWCHGTRERARGSRLRAAWLGAILIVALSATNPRPAEAQRRSGRGPVGVALVVDGPGAGYRELTSSLRSELEALLGDSRPIAFTPDESTFQDFTPAGVARALDAAYADPSVDVVIAVGVLGTRDVVAREALPKPTILPVVAPPGLSEVPNREGRSGRENLNYVLGVVDIDEDLARFKELVPYEHLVAIFDAHVVGVLPDLEPYLVERAGGATVTVVTIAGDVDATLAAIPETVDAAYLGGVPGTAPELVDRLVEALTERGIPTFSSAGPSAVERGALATITPEADWVRRARRVALHVERILDGEPAARLPVDFEPAEQLVINLGAARRLGVYPSFALLTEAELVNQTRTTAPRELDLPAVIAEALQRNLDLRSAAAGVRVGAQDVVIARSPLLPSLSVSATGHIIDEDRATPIQAGGAETVVSWRGEATQVLFDELAWTGFRAQERVQEGIERDFDRQRLDVIQAAATAFLDVLRAKTAERIQRENLELTRANLALAEIRRRVGTAGPNEVYRFQIQVATNRADVIRASANRNQSEIELNRVLARELEEPFLTADTGMTTPGLLSSDERVETYFTSPQKFRILRDFLARESLRNAPELKQLDANIAAETRNVDGRERALWLPSFGLSGTVDHFFFDAGAGSDAGNIPDMLPEGFLPNPDEWAWTVGVSASLPLYAGSERYGRIRQSQARIIQLEAQREAARLAVEGRVRAALHAAGASRASVALTQQAAEAARANLEVVTDAYQRGAEDIITLVDAQTQAVTQELAAANAVFDFLRDFVAVERAVGRFEYDMEDDEVESFFERLADYERRQLEASQQVPEEGS